MERCSTFEERDMELTEPGPARKPSTVSEAAGAHLLTLLIGQDHLSPVAALAELQQRVERFRDPAAPAALEELAGHLPILDALFKRYAAESLRARGPEGQARLLRAALQAQTAHARTVVLLEGLKGQRQGLTRVVLEDSASGDPGALPDLLP